MKEEAKKLARFNTRMGMYIFPSEKSNIEAFLHGFELGNDYKFKLTEEITKLLSEKYDIGLDSMGWSNQIERFAVKRGIEWTDAYSLISSEILNSYLENGK